MNNPKYLALITIFFWSFGAYLSRLISIQSQFALLSVSYIFALATLGIYFVAQDPQHILSGFKKSFRPSFLLWGLLGYFLYSVSTIQSFRAFESASETTLLNYTWPLFTVIFTILIFKASSERSLSYRVIEGVGISISFFAVVIIATEGNVSALDFSNITGIIWGLLAGLSYGLFSAYSSTVKKSDQAVFLLSSISASLFLMLLFSASELEVVRSLRPQDILVAATMGCLLDGIGYITWTRANRLSYDLQVDISSIASLMFALPLFSLVIVAILLGENRLFQPYFIISLICVMVGSYTCQRPDAVLAMLARKEQVQS